MKPFLPLQIRKNGQTSRQNPKVEHYYDNFLYEYGKNQEEEEGGEGWGMGDCTYKVAGEYDTTWLGLVFHGGSDVAGCFLAVLDKRFESLLHLLLSRVDERDRAGVSVGCVG